MILKKYLKSFLSFFLILFVCFLPGNEADNFVFFDFPYFDKIVHFLIFSLFSLSLYFEISKNTDMTKKKIFVFILISVIIIASGTEIVQYFFINGRTGSFFDFLADTVSIFVVIALLKY